MLLLLLHMLLLSPPTAAGAGPSSWAQEFADNEADYADWDDIFARNAEVSSSTACGLRLCVCCICWLLLLTAGFDPVYACVSAWPLGCMKEPAKCRVFYSS